MEEALWRRKWEGRRQEWREHEKEEGKNVRETERGGGKLREYAREYERKKGGKGKMKKKKKERKDVRRLRRERKRRKR